MRSAPPVFIHSQFRTGSTYVWNKFRRCDVFHCYYEPFHPELASLGSEDPTRWSSGPAAAASMGHPRLDREYMHEYRHLLRPGKAGVPGFKKAFAFDNFCPGGRHRDQKRYVDSLLQNSGPKVPLLQFNRTSLRVAWFKDRYPRALHVYLLRDPRQQFHSILRLREREGLDIFAVMNLLAAGVNVTEGGAFRALARRVPLFEYHAADLAQEEEFYRKLLPVYSVAEQYSIHFCIWFAALLENLAHADLLLDIDLLTSSDAYRALAVRRLAAATGTTLDFGDAGVTRTETPLLPEAELRRIEGETATMLLAGIRPRQVAKLADRFDGETLKEKGTHRRLWLDLRGRRLAAVAVKEGLVAKQEAILRMFSPRMVELRDAIEASRAQLQAERAGEALGLLVRSHDALLLETRALTDLLSIPRGQTGGERAVAWRVRSWLGLTRRSRSTPSDAERPALRGGRRLAGRQRTQDTEAPIVTVVTVVRNDPKGLERTIQSVQRQSGARVELIVIDGGSDRPTLDVIERYADGIDCWVSEPDHGIYDAMNKGTELASGEWVIFLNCGDSFYRDDTVQRVFSQDHRDVDFVYGHTEFLGGDHRGVVLAWGFDILWKTMIFTHQSLFSRRAVLRKRPFDTRLRICADFDLIYNAWASGSKFRNSGVVIASFDPGFSERRRARMAWEKWQVVRRHRNDLRFHLFYLQLFLRRLVRDGVRWSERHLGGLIRP